MMLQINTSQNDDYPIIHEDTTTNDFFYPI